MEDNSNASGIIGALLVGAGFAAAILAPFYILWRFGIHYIAAFVAPIATLIAIYQADLLAYFDGNYGQYDRMLHTYFSMPWTAIAVMAWIGLVLCFAAVVFDMLPSWLAGSRARAKR